MVQASKAIGIRKGESSIRALNIATGHLTLIMASGYLLVFSHVRTVVRLRTLESSFD